MQRIKCRGDQHEGHAPGIDTPCRGSCKENRRSDGDDNTNNRKLGGGLFVELKPEYNKERIEGVEHLCDACIQFAKSYIVEDRTDPVCGARHQTPNQPNRVYVKEFSSKNCNDQNK